MANALFDFGRQGFLDGSIDWDTDTIKCLLIDTALYTVNLATHDNLDDVAAGARGGTAQTLGTKTVTAGVADAADISFPSVPGTVSYEALLLYKDTGVEATSRLIAFIDTATGLPVTSNGGNIAVAWDSGANRIFKL